MGNENIFNFVDKCNIRELELLWTNDEPLQPFGATTLRIDNLSDYKVFIIVCNAGAATTTPKMFCITSIMISNDGPNWMYEFGSLQKRRVHISISDSAINFDNGIDVNSTTGVETEDRRDMIPYRIYGIR